MLSRLWCGAVWALACGFSAHGAVTLVEDGRPAAAIVIGLDAGDKAQAAAAELQTYVARISGATLPIVRENEAFTGARVYVGRSAAVTALGVETPQGWTSRYDEEAFVSKTVNGDLVLAGNEDGQYNGTAYAVYDLLEELGVRWYYPGDFGEIVPQAKTLTVADRDRIERPSFRFRTIMLMGWYPYTPEQAAEFRLWALRNKMSTIAISFPGDGSIVNLAPKDRYFESHPHIYAMNEKGERVHEMLCLSEEETVAIALRTIGEHFAANPESLSFGFAPPDGFPMCHCERCKQFEPAFMGRGLGDPSISEPWFRFVNTIAAAVAERHPGKWIMTNGYANRVRPPESTGPLSPNIGLQLAVLPACTNHRTGDPRCWQRLDYERLVDRWTGALDNVFIYDYTPGISLAFLPEPSIHRLKHDMPYYRDRGVWGFFTEGGHAPMITQLSYYIRAKLMWNADADVDALLADFCGRFFGAASKPMARYIATLERAVEKTNIHETWGRIMRWDVILKDHAGDLDRLMAEAEAAEVDDATAMRIRMYRHVHDHMNAYLSMENAVVEGDYAAAVDQGQRMLAIRAAAGEERPNWLPTTPDWAKTFRTTAEWHIDQYTALAERAGGPKGELVTLLPREWRFKKDPEDKGVLFQWYTDPVDRSWEPIDATIYWEAQGHEDEKGWGYWGKAWYRTAFDLPASYEGKPVWLTIGGVYNRGVWVWVNGRMMEFDMERHWRLGHHDSRTPLHIDISAVARPGAANEVAVCVYMEPPGRNPRGGMHRRAFVWSPREGALAAPEAEAAQPVVPD